MKRLFAPLIIATALAVLAVLSIPTPAFAQGAAVAIIPAGSSWSGIGCAIVTNAIGIVVNGTPTNYTPTESHVAGHLTGLDVKLGEFDLQQAAENGATVVGMPITLGQVTIASPAAATNSLMLRLLGVNPSDPSTYRGGVIGWSNSADTGLSGYTYVNSDNQLVWDTTAQAAYNDAGVAWVDFDDGSASFGGGGLTISSAGVLGGSGAATWLATLTTALNMRSDSVGVQFGAADDAKVWFDGDSLNIKPNQVTASDILEIQGIMNVTNKLGIGQVSPTARLEVLSTTEQLRLGYDANNWHKWVQGAFPIGLSIYPKANCTQSWRYQDKDQNTLFNIDSSNRRGAINSTAPDRAWEVNSTNGNCLRLTYNDADGTAANYVDFAVSSGGNLTITASSGTITLATNVTVSGQIRGNHYTAATNQLANGTYTIFDGTLTSTTDGTITITDGLVTGYQIGGQNPP